jgi:hypothetical protein
MCCKFHPIPLDRLKPPNLFPGNSTALLSQLGFCWHTVG